MNRHGAALTAALPTPSFLPRPQATLLSVITDRALDALPELASLGLDEAARDALLALRGLLAYGLLENLLQMRPDVAYGINRCAKRQLPGGGCWLRPRCVAGGEAAVHA